MFPFTPHVKSGCQAERRTLKGPVNLAYIGGGEQFTQPVWRASRKHATRRGWGRGPNRIGAGPDDRIIWVGIDELLGYGSRESECGLVNLAVADGTQHRSLLISNIVNGIESYKIVYGEHLTMETFCFPYLFLSFIESVLM